MARSLKPGEGADKGAPLAPVADAEDDQLWRMLTRSANSAFAQARWADARRLYDRALVEADRLFALACTGGPTGTCDPAPMLVAATANAAENWIKLDRQDRAAEAMTALCRRLCAVIQDDARPHDFREQCFVHLKPATLELMALLPRAGWPADRIAHEVDHARGVALRFIDAHISKH